MKVLIQNARIVTGDESPVIQGSVRIEGERITEVAPALDGLPDEQVIDADGRVIMPGFIDAHTHAAWAGDRLDEFEQRARGASYLEILSRGGGILSTVRAVRTASRAELTERLLERLACMLREGTTTVEVKSGYGLSTEHELKMLRAIADAKARFPGTVVATALLGHAIDPAEIDGVEQVVRETLPAVHAEFPGIAIDAFCENGAWSLDDCARLLERAAELGHPLRLHTDQFNSLGGIDLALRLAARSVDHLEVTGKATLERLAASNTFAVLLPATSFQLETAYADGRYLLDRGAKVVLATNCNPGSAPTMSMPFILALAVRKLGLSFGEAMQSVSSRAAELLGLFDRGRIAPGYRADLLLLRHRDERLLAYEFGGNPIERVICGGRLIRGGRPRELA